MPWIVAHGHRSIYCSCDDDCDAPAVSPIRDGWGGKFGWEELFFDQGVDLWLNGHEHNYERTWPVYHHRSDDSNVSLSPSLSPLSLSLSLCLSLSLSLCLLRATVQSGQPV